MKKIISICIAFILFLWTVMFLASCTPVRYVNINRPHTYKHHFNVHTVPVWIPGHGVMLQQQRWHIPVRPKTPYRYTKPLQRPNTNWRVPRKN